MEPSYLIYTQTVEKLWPFPKIFTKKFSVGIPLSFLGSTKKVTKEKINSCLLIKYNKDLLQSINTTLKVAGKSVANEASNNEEKAAF